MEFSVRAEWADISAGGWNNEYRLSPQELYKTVCSNWFAVSAFNGDSLVGFGRVVSDGLLHAMIYEMIVLSEYQGQGIGAQVLRMLIQLFSARGKRGFYEKFGFAARPDDTPGMQYEGKRGDP